VGVIDFGKRGSPRRVGLFLDAINKVRNIETWGEWFYIRGFGEKYIANPGLGGF
jgi:hypothetical protein